MATCSPVKNKPDLPSYPVNTLELFPRFDRPGFVSHFGEQPPPFDPNSPPKSWFDTSPGAGNYQRISLDSTNKPSVIPFTMTSELAAKPNIPGAYQWPKYNIPVTSAVMMTPAGTSLPYPARLLSTEDQARQLALEVSGTFEIDPESTASAFPVNYGSETRRVYQIMTAEGQTRNAGEMLAEKYVNGIGAPGAWGTGLFALNWSPAAQVVAPLDPKVQEIPVPCRPLDDDEEFRQGFGGLYAIWKKTAAPAVAPDDSVRLLKILLDYLGVKY